MAFDWKQDGQTFTTTNQELQEDLHGVNGEGPQQWARTMSEQLSEFGYFDDPELYEAGEPETLEEPPDEEPPEGYEWIEVPQWGDDGWIAVMRSKIEVLQQKLGRKLTEAEGTALREDVDGLGYIPEDFTERYGDELAARGSTPQERERASRIQSRWKHPRSNLVNDPRGVPRLANLLN
jgi:hypothetical protein